LVPGRSTPVSFFVSEAFRIEFESSAFACERKLVEQAFALNRAGKSLTTILDDAHLVELACLRKLRLLFEDFPKNHNLVLIGRPSLLAALDLAINQDIKSRVTYSVLVKRLGRGVARTLVESIRTPTPEIHRRPPIQRTQITHARSPQTASIIA